MKWFWRSRTLRDWEEGIRPELSGLRAPAPSPDLWARVVASRNAGVRVILPDVPQSRSYGASRRLLLPAIAAGLLLLVVPVVWRPTHEAVAPSPDAGQFVSDLFTGRVAFAEPAPAQILPPLRLDRPAALRPIALEYQQIRRNGLGQAIDSVRQQLTMRATVERGIPAWSLIATGSGMRSGKSVVDSGVVVVARDNLRLMHRTMIVEPYASYDRMVIHQEFRGDSVVGSVNASGRNAPAANHTIAQRLRADWSPFVDDAFGPILLGAATLGEGWSARASLLGWAVVDGDVAFPLELRVVGSERASVPAGTFDCWRIALRFAGRDMQMWVRKSDGVGVRVRQPGADGVREGVLISERQP